MGRDYYYKPGSFYRLDDRSGFRVRAERTRKEWDNLIVADRFWEPRQPQDFVKGVRDDQNVPEARPRPTPTFIGPYQSTLSANALFGAGILAVSQPFGYSPGDTLGVMLNSGVVFKTIVLGAGSGGGFSSGFSSGFSVFTVLPTGSVFISPPLTGPADSGNLITDFSTAEIQPNQYGASNGQ